MLTERDLETLPAFLTVEEAARVLRLKRTTAYEATTPFLCWP